MKITIQSILATSFAVAFVSNAQAQVTNISSETFAQYGKDEAYFVADVSCNQGGAARAIQRKTDGDEWCGKDVAGFCGASKDAAAKKVCSSDYTATLEEVETKAKAEREAAAAKARAVAAEKERAAQARKAQQERARAAQIERDKKAAVAAAAPLKKKISIEEQLIKIEQEKLDLRRQELELQRRAVEIQKLLDENG